MTKAWKKTPYVWRLNTLIEHCQSGAQMGLPNDGGYVPARPEGFWSIGVRIGAAWLVLTGQADAVLWPWDQ